MRLCFLLCLYLLLYYNPAVSQTLLSTETFDSDILIHGSSATTTVWFAPDYYTPIDFVASGGCTGGHAGFQGSWNNYWMNFIRTPAVDCSLLDTVILTVDISNSYVTSHTNDKVYFNMWIDGGYHDAVVNQTIWFDQARDCQTIEVIYDLTPYIDKSAVLFYLNASCGYNDSQTYYVKFDNISIKSNNTNNTTCKPFAGNDTTVCNLNFCFNNAYLSDSISGCTWTTTYQPTGSIINFSDTNNVNTCIIPDTYGYYEFVITETNDTCTDYDTIAVDFPETPNINAGTDQVVCGLETFLNASTDSTTGYWQNTNGITFADTTNPQTQITANNYGTFILIWNTSNQICSATDTVTIIFDPCTQIDEHYKSKINIFPNPTTGKITINNKSKNTSLRLEVFDIYGKNVLQFKTNSSNTEIDISSQPKGIYIIKTITARNIAFKKIVLE